MDLHTGLGRDLLRTLIGWRIDELMMCLPLDKDFGDEDADDDEKEVVAAGAQARTVFVDAVMDAVIAPPDRNLRQTEIGKRLLTADQAETILTPALSTVVHVMGHGTDERTHRADSAMAIAFVTRIWAPEATLYCVESAASLDADLRALATFITEADLGLDRLDKDAHHAFLERTTTPMALHERISSFVNRVTDEEPLFDEGRTVIEREFADPIERRRAENHLALHDLAKFSARCEGERRVLKATLADAIEKIWPPEPVPPTLPSRDN